MTEETAVEEVASSEAMDEVQTTEESSPNVVVIRSWEDNSDKSPEDMEEFNNFVRAVKENEGITD